ncbi:hypothetical protein SAMN05518672_10833 [Chitinophaga sp. CF118]|uniref:hypothetical protein n=1 Tax=Chitinophaga sp. CF118 TaxID=1884367 RepID=UPI0008E1B667|nr:hypothetical protein [Chitinophaga sp. CF118]SFE59093.1 hypothetical protein SAMN05518672_10833 [Chitinophaga sp. CF118]
MSISKTQWEIESDRVIIRPHRIVFILASVLAVVFIALFLLVQKESPGHMVPLVVVMALVWLPFVLGGFTYVIFDRNASRMKKMLFGFLPIRNVPFEKLYQVNIVTQGSGGFNFRIYTKANKYGRGTMISSHYGKDTDPNAVAFSNEVIPLIHQYLDAVAPLKPENTEITNYEYFTEADGIYTLKVKKAGLLVFGSIFLALGIHECTPDAWITDLNIAGKLLMTVFQIALGVVFIAAAYTRLIFNTPSRIIERKSPIGIGNRQFSFDSFVNFQTVRKTYNGVYSGTDINMLFEATGKKNNVLRASTFKNTQQIERFMLEIRKILAS